MRAAQWQAVQEIRLAELEEPVAGPGQAVIEVTACGICGSDLHSYLHGMAAVPGQVLGHEVSGRVLTAPGVAGLEPGQRVTVRPLIPCGACAGCLRGEPQLCEAGMGQNIGYGARGGFAQRLLVPRAAVGETVFVLPDSVSDHAGALVEPFAVALHAVRLARPEPGDVAVVSGLGAIGLGAVQALRAHGVRRILGVDPSPLRRACALDVGAAAAIDPEAADVVAAVQEWTGVGAWGRGARADLVVECSGVPEALTAGLKTLRHGGTLVVAAVYARKWEINPTRLMEKELTFRGSFAYGDEFPRVLRLLAAGDLAAERLVSHVFPLARIEEAFAAQLERDSSIKVIVEP